VKSRALNSLLVFFVWVCCTTALQAQGSHPIPPGVRQADQAQDQFDKNSVPPMEPRARIDPAKMKHDADELAAIAQSVPSAIDAANKGVLEKDLNEKLKRIEKLAKGLRTQLSQ
jgi:hypothetical protein